MSASMSAYCYIDSHCHLAFDQIGEFADYNRAMYAVKQLIERANNVGVKYLLTIGTKLSDIEEIREISDSNKNVFRTVGIHPLEAKGHIEKYSISEIEDIITESIAKSDLKLAGIGEIGLDYHYGKESQELQQKFFDLQVDLAQKSNLPVCIHSRDAEEDTIAILKNYPGIRGVIHCFTGSEKFAFDSLDLGFYISASGIITFKKSNELRETIRKVPFDKLLIETDAPFLAPVPCRGKTNEPAFVIHTAEKVAEILRKSSEEVAKKTSENFFNLYTRCARNQ